MERENAVWGFGREDNEIGQFGHNLVAIRTLQIPNMYLAAMSVGKRVLAFHGGPELGDTFDGAFLQHRK